MAKRGERPRLHQAAAAANGVVLVLALLLGSAGPAHGATGPISCTTDYQCPGDMICIQHLCALPRPQPSSPQYPLGGSRGQGQVRPGSSLISLGPCTADDQCAGDRRCVNSECTLSFPPPPPPAPVSGYRRALHVDESRSSRRAGADLISLGPCTRDDQCLGERRCVNGACTLSLPPPPAPQVPVQLPPVFYPPVVLPPPSLPQQGLPPPIPQQGLPPPFPQEGLPPPMPSGRTPGSP